MKNPSNCRFRHEFSWHTPTTDGPKGLYLFLINKNKFMILFDFFVVVIHGSNFVSTRETKFREMKCFDKIFTRFRYISVVIVIDSSIFFYASFFSTILSNDIFVNENELFYCLRFVCCSNGNEFQAFVTLSSREKI